MCTNCSKSSKWKLTACISCDLNIITRSLNAHKRLVARAAHFLSAVWDVGAAVIPIDFARNQTSAVLEPPYKYSWGRFDSVQGYVPFEVWQPFVEPLRSRGHHKDFVVLYYVYFSSIRDKCAGQMTTCLPWRHDAVNTCTSNVKWAAIFLVASTHGVLGDVATFCFSPVCHSDIYIMTIFVDTLNTRIIFKIIVTGHIKYR